MSRPAPAATGNSSNDMPLSDLPATVQTLNSLQMYRITYGDCNAYQMNREYNNRKSGSRGPAFEVVSQKGLTLKVALLEVEPCFPPQILTGSRTINVATLVIDHLDLDRSPIPGSEPLPSVDLLLGTLECRKQLLSMDMSSSAPHGSVFVWLLP